MCGICGISGEGRDNREITRAMCSVISHRGPDADGFFFHNAIALGHRRLSIIDLHTGDQPIYNEDKSVVVIFNGEIYNFKDFKKDLVARGHKFATQSDTEILVHCYEEYGLSFLSDLNGIFAFALYDVKREKLALVRDHFGIKPLFYWFDGRTLVFASEQKAILMHPAVERQINLNAVHCQINLRYNQGSETLFKGIHKISPGHYLVHENRRIFEKKYYEVKPRPDKSLSESTINEGIHYHLQQAVRRQLLSDVPVGVYLSGGMDSSAIVSMMHELNVPTINTFTMGFNEDTDEFPDAAMVAKHYDTNHQTTSLSLQPLKQFPEVIWHAEEPKINLLQGFNMSAFVSPGYKVILGGLGGDELFAGYDINKFVNSVKYLLAVTPAGLQKGMLEPLSKLLFKVQSASGTFRFDEFRRGLQMLLSIGDLQKFYLIMRNCWDYDRKFMNTIYHPAVDPDHITPVGTYFDDLFSASSGLPPLDAVAYVELYSKMINDYLLVDDRMSMAHSVELRVPFLDKDLVEFMFTVPASRKIKFGETKYLFRRAMRPYLPEKIIKKKKWGFTVNPYEQFRKDLKTTVEKILTKKFVEEQGIFNYNYIKSILEYPPHPRLRWHYNYIWVVMGIAIWQRMFIDSNDFMNKDFATEKYYS